MAGPGFTETFGGSVITPAQSSYNNIALTQNITLLWPTELSIAGSPVVSDIMDVTAAAANLSIAFSDATQASTGYTALFNNIGANTFSVLDVNGDTLLSVASGQAWLIYLADNSTPQGVWRIFQMGAGASSANAAALAGAGLKAITTTLNEFVTIQAINANYVAVLADRATALEWAFSGVGGITLPPPGTVGTGWFVYIKNSGGGNLTVTPSSGTIDGAASLVFAPENSAIVVCDGANYFTIGFGQIINSVFSFIQIDITGQASPMVLSGVQLNRVSYQFVGALTHNLVVVVPATVQQYWIDNETSGAFTLSFESPTPGTISAVGQGQRNILYCDGVNVVPAVTFGATGFANGSPGAPPLFFTASTSTGLYSPGANQLAVTINGAEMLAFDATGHATFFGPSSAGVAHTLNGNTAAPGQALRVAAPFSASGANAAMQLVSTAANGFCALSICGNNGTPGTTDLSIFQNGTTGEARIVNNNTGTSANIFLTTANSNTSISLAPNGTTILQAFNTIIELGLSGLANSIGLNTLTSTAATAGGAPALPATPSGYITVAINGGNAKIPYYAP